MITSGNLVLKYNFWIKGEVKSKFYIPITLWRHYIFYNVGYILEYILNRKSSGHETWATNKYRHGQYFQKESFIFWKTEY